MRKIRATNAFSLILCLMTLPYTLIFYLMNVGWASITVLFVGLAYLCVVLLNSRGFFDWARIYLLVLVNLATFFYSLLFGTGSAVYLLFLPFATLPMMIFERKDRWPSIFGFLMSMLLFLIASDLRWAEGMGIPWAPLPEVHLPVVITIFFISGFLMYSLQRSNDNADEELLLALGDLQIETARCHKILDAITDMIILSDTESQPLWGNKAFRDFYGLSGESFAGVFASSDPIFPFTQKHGEYDRKVVQSRQPCWIEAEPVQSLDGSERWVNTVKSPIVNAEGQVVMIVSVCRDITAQYEMKQLLAQQRVQMVASAKLSALGEMAAGIAHEINNPLAIIAGRSLTLKLLVANDPGNSQAISRFAQDIEDTTYRIVKIIRGLQSFSRSGDNDPFARVALRTIVDDTLTFCAARFADSGIQLIVRGLTPDLLLECRPVQISQVLLNVMNNAYDGVKNRAEKWIELEVSRTAGFLDISITDSGPGIPVGIRERIFEPFFTGKPVGEGTGLGLSIARGLVESHQGSIVLDESCKNTKIQIRLPLSQRDVSPETLSVKA